MWSNQNLSNRSFFPFEKCICFTPGKMINWAVDGQQLITIIIIHFLTASDDKVVRISTSIWRLETRVCQATQKCISHQMTARYGLMVWPQLTAGEKRWHMSDIKRLLEVLATESMINHRASYTTEFKWQGRVSDITGLGIPGNHW